MLQREAEGMGARTRNTHGAAIVAFGNWCVETSRLTANPFARLCKADEKTDCRRQRRALTENELVRLLNAARRRPLLEAMTVRKGERKGQTVADVRPDVRRRLAMVGQERALIYKTLVLTGLRKGELASLTVGQVELEGERPGAVLNAAHAKNRQSARIPLRGDLAADLGEWLCGKLEAVRDDCRASGEPIPARLPPDTPLFAMPDKLSRVMDRDLKLAGIPKRDDRGRTADVHALRHTFGTHLSKGGVAPRTAQAAMRHGSINLTMNTYTDPELLDVQGALNVLPQLPLAGDDGAQRGRATGTDGAGALAPMLAPKPDDWCISESTAGKRAGVGAENAEALRMARKGARAVLGGDSGEKELVGAAGFEPATSSPPC